jgi:3-dehydroquinate synthase
MKKVAVELGERSYDIIIGSGNLSGIGEKLKTFNFSPDVAVVSNPTVFALYGAQVVNSLEDAGFGCFTVIIPDGEEYKDYNWTYHILTEFLKHGLDRKSCVIALGGGVIGDITGFAASTYMRGINFVQIPTTLLAQVDSSVGGKTGVNHSLGKNMIGTFYQPRLVWVDVKTLATLRARDFTSGIAEIIKYGVIYDADLFEYMVKKRDEIAGHDAVALTHIIKRSCAIKSEIVSHDERESGLRAILNFGHNVGHAVETETRYQQFTHGEAVGLGMCLESILSESFGLLKPAETRRIAELIAAYGLPTVLPEGMDAKRLLTHMKLDKKTVAGELTFILPDRIGGVLIKKGVKAEDVIKALAGK